MEPIWDFARTYWFFKIVGNLDQFNKKNFLRANFWPSLNFSECRALRALSFLEIVVILDGCLGNLNQNSILRNWFRILNIFPHCLFRDLKRRLRWCGAVVWRGFRNFASQNQQKQDKGYKSLWCTLCARKGRILQLTRVGVLSIYKCCFFHKMSGSKILGFVIQFASLVGKVVV